MKKTDMSDDEQRAVLERIARDDEVHARDRIAAIRALMAINRQTSRALDDELDRILRK